MTGERDKLEGKMNEAGGNIREKVGEATGDERMEGEGKAQQLEGKGQQLAGGIKDKADDAKDAVGDAADKVKDKLT